MAIETDENRVFRGFQPSGFERDRRKDADLRRAGYEVLRITWSQVEYAPDEVVLTLRAALAR